LREDVAFMTKSYRTRRKAAGGTVVEILTLLFIVFTVYIVSDQVCKKTVENADFCMCQVNMKSLVASIESFRHHMHRYPDSLKELRRSNFIRHYPACPSYCADTYSSGYRVNHEKTRFTLQCTGYHHSSIVYGPDRPLVFIQKAGIQ